MKSAFDLISTLLKAYGQRCLGATTHYSFQVSLLGVGGLTANGNQATVFLHAIYSSSQKTHSHKRYLENMWEYCGGNSSIKKEFFFIFIILWSLFCFNFYSFERTKININKGKKKKNKIKKLIYKRNIATI